MDSLETKKRFLSVTLAVTAISCSGSFVNFLAQALLAYRFGTSVEVDAYTYALSLPTFLSALIGIIVSYTAIPKIAQANAFLKGTYDFSRSLSFILLFSAACFALIGLTAGWWQTLLLPPAKALTLFPDLPILIRLAWVVGAFQILIALASAQLNASGRPLIAAFLAIPTNSVTISILLFFSEVSINFALMGMVTGAALSCTFGFWFARRTLLPPTIANWRLFVHRKSTTSTLLAAITLSCFASYALVDAVWASRVGEGALASMGYAHRIVVGLGALVVAGPSALFVPRFAVLIESRQIAAFRRLLFTGIVIVGGLGCVLAVGIFVFSDLIVGLMFERGAFGAASSAIVADALRHMAPGVFAMLLSVIVLRAIFCLPSFERTSAAIGLLFTASYALLSYSLLNHGVVGIATAYSISWCGFLLMLLAFIFIRLKRMSS